MVSNSFQEFENKKRSAKTKLTRNNQPVKRAEKKSAKVLEGDGADVEFTSIYQTGRKTTNEVLFV